MKLRDNAQVKKAEDFFISCDECDKEAALKNLVDAYHEAEAESWDLGIIKHIKVLKEKQNGFLTDTQTAILHMAQRSLGLPETD